MRYNEVGRAGGTSRLHACSRDENNTGLLRRIGFSASLIEPDGRGGEREMERERGRERERESERE